jgi:hypothetical protein
VRCEISEAEAQARIDELAALEPRHAGGLSDK